MPDSAYSLLFSSGNQETQTPSTEGSATAPVPTPTSGGSGSSAFGLLFGGSSPESPLSGQDAGVSAPTQHLYQDSTQPWYKRAWDWANTPLTESLFGLPEDRPGAGGFERGIEHIASGLTSPLSVALTAATFGTGGFIESAGASALREAGLTAAEIADVSKGSQIALDTAKELPEGATAVSDAVKAGGVDPALWKRGQDILYNNGLTEHDLLQGNMVERGAYQILRKTVPELPISVTARAAKTANAVLNAGFTYQQLESAAAMSPRFLDALKEGDSDKALEYGTEMFASGALGVLGTSHALHSAGELFKPLIESNAVRPSDEWNSITRANSERDAQHAEAEQQAVNLSAQAKELLGHGEPRPILGDTKEVKAQKDLELATVLHQIVTGGDTNKAAEWHDALAEAAGRNEEIAAVRPNNGPIPNPDLQTLSQDYTKSSGIDKTPHEGLAEVNPETGKQIADAYEAMQHNPDDPKVKASYDALIRETKAQWDAAKAAGYTFEPWPHPGQPYADSLSPSKAMAEDVRNNKHLYYFTGGEVPENHPLAGVDPATGETYNNVFRAVHDLFGHAKNGYEFGPRGEENAFLAHSRMYSDEAVPALLSETKGQNSWVNFGKHLRDENGNLPVRGEKGFVPPPERPFAEQKAGILPAEIVNPHLGKEPQVGTPIETPSRAGTKVVHSNDAGEVRVGADGRPVVWLSPEAWEAYNRIAHPGNRIAGVSYSPEEAADVAKSLLDANENGDAQKVLDLFWKAQNLSKQNLLTAAKTGAPVVVAAEELHHTWQRELSQDGEIRNHLDPKQWSKLYAIIPTAWKAELDRDGYPDDPVTRVAETTAQFRSGKANGVVPDTDIVRFLDSYYAEVEAKHGGNVIESARKINDVAAQHVKDIYENRRTGQAATEGGVADRQANNGQLPRVETGRETGAPEVGPREPQTGLESREPDEFDKLSGLKLRVGMGDPGSAGLVTGDNDVLIGRDHADLIREAGYKVPANAKPSEALYEKFFRDGGVRIRTGGGVAHVDFMEPNADTWDRVYRSIASIPEANRYYVDFRPLKGGTGFNISAYDKDNLLYQLQDLENGGQRPAAPGSVQYFRQGPEFRPNNGLFAKDRDNLAPTWYLKSNQLIDSRMSGPMPADTVLKMLENNGVKPDELKYTGLQEFLKDKGKEPVRPEELRSYLAANNLQISEVTKGDVELSQADYSRWRNLQTKVMFGRATPEETEEFRNLDTRIPNSGNPEVERGIGTKFGSYTLPGGENYRELLLTLPEVGEVRHVRPPGSLGRTVSERVGQFTTSHWDEPNVVGHVRFNDRTGPNGEKLLHLEELQSDWHQKGRTQGYTPQPRWSVQDKEDGTVLASYSTEAEARTHAAREAGTQVIQDRTLTGAVPDAPFKKTWPELLLKRMVRYASEHGYDGISWTPGEEQAARYDLSKQIDQVAYNPKSRMLVAYGSYGDKVLNQQVEPEKIQDYIGKEAAQKLLNTAVDEKHGYQTLNNADLKVGGEGMKGFYDKIVPEAANKLGKQFGAKVGETKASVGTLARNDRYGYNGPELSREDVSQIYKDIKEGRRDNPSLAEGTNFVNRSHLDSTLVQIAGEMGKGASYGEAVGAVLADNKSLLENYAKEMGGKIEQKKYQFKKVPYFPITDSMRESVLKQGQPLFARSPDNGQLDEQIRSNVFKNQPKEYQDLVLESLRRVASGELSDREQAAAKFLRDEQDKNFEIGSSNDLLHHYLEDYMTRVYKDANPKGKVILSDAKGGKFATNVSMAKQRVYDSNLTALLKSPKQMLLDPVDITARGRAMLIKAAANRQLIDTLRDKFTRASDGRPAVVLSGSGQVVSGANGEDPKTFIDPNRVRKININPKVVDQLTKSGDLQRFLDEGTIKDITPYVRPNNIGAAIEKLEEQSQRKDAQYDAVGNNKLRTDLMFLKSMQANNDFSGLKAFNDAQEKQYAWDPQDYVSLANGAMKGWNFITNSPDGTPIYVRSDIKVHPEFAEYLQNRLGLAPSEISKHPIGKALLGAGTRLKQTLLSLSPFHMVQEALRGIMVGVNPFHISGPDILTGEKVDPSDPNSPTIIRKAVEHGFTTGTDYQALQAHSEGLAAGGGGLISKIPGVGKVISNSLDWYQNFLFKRYIPALKARSVELMFHEYQRLHPEWSTDRVAKAAALHTNDTFGGINWQAMGRSATTQDWGRLLLLAPDWLESEMRSGARLFNKDEGGLGRAQVAKMALGLWGIARVLNLVTTGNAHYEAPFGLAVKNKEGKETVFSIRTLPTDLLHAASDPVGFIQGRLSPALRAGTELTTGRDQFGRKLQPSDLWADVFRNMAPIPLQSLGQAVSDTGPQIGNIGQGWKSIGGTAQTYQTPAQKMAADLASTHSEDGPVDPSQMARHHRVIQLEDQVRAGEMSWPDVYKLAYQTDQISESELKKIQENVKATHGMDASMASLFSRASRLPAKEYLDLLDVSNPSERAALVPLTIKVQKRYLTKAKKEETPEERAKDPVFQRLLRMIPGSTQNFQPQPQSSVVTPIPAPIQKEVAYLYSATHPETGHRVGSNDGQTWYDHQTGAPVNG